MCDSSKEPHWLTGHKCEDEKYWNLTFWMFFVNHTVEFLVRKLKNFKFNLIVSKNHSFNEKIFVIWNLFFVNHTIKLKYSFLFSHQIYDQGINAALLSYRTIFIFDAVQRDPGARHDPGVQHYQGARHDPDARNELVAGVSHQLDGNSFCEYVFLDSFNKASWNEDKI